MWIPDPSDLDDCLPSLTSGVLNKFSVGIFSAGLGFKIGRIEGDCFFLNIGYMGSFRPMEYMHHKYMDAKPRPAMDDVHAHHHQSQSGARDVNMDFINVFNSDVHSHKIGEIYHSHLRFVYINFGWAFAF